MEIQQVKYFLVLARELHFWKTAEQVSISQSSLSRQIQALENEIGVQLFIRNKRNVKLTDAGKFLEKNWTKILRELNQTHRQAQKIHEGNTGTIAITYPGSIAFSFLPSFLETLNKTLPELKLELTEPNDENHEHLLLNYQTDIAFSRDIIENNSIISYKLNTEPLCLVVPNQKKHVNSLEELQNEKFIISGLHRTTSIAALLRNLFSKHNFEPNTIIESDFGGMILNLVSKNLGVTILPKSYQYANTANVSFIPLKEKTHLYLHWRKNEINKVTLNVIKYAQQVKL